RPVTTARASQRPRVLGRASPRLRVPRADRRRSPRWIVTSPHLREEARPTRETRRTRARGNLRGCARAKSFRDTEQVTCQGETPAHQVAVYFPARPSVNPSHRSVNVSRTGGDAAQLGELAFAACQRAGRALVALHLAVGEAADGALGARAGDGAAALRRHRARGELETAHHAVRSELRLTGAADRTADIGPRARN